MTNKAMLKRLREEIVDDGELDEEARLTDILDWLACIGIEGAAETYSADIQLERPSTLA